MPSRGRGLGRTAPPGSENEVSAAAEEWMFPWLEEKMSGRAVAETGAFSARVRRNEVERYPERHGDLKTFGSVSSPLHSIFGQDEVSKTKCKSIPELLKPG